MTEFFFRNPGGEIGETGKAGDFKIEGARLNDFQHSGHADGVGAELGGTRAVVSQKYLGADGADALQDQTMSILHARRRMGSELRMFSESEIMLAMSNKEMVTTLLARLPDDTPLEDIAREIALLAGIKIAREQAARREGISAEDARVLVSRWAAGQ